MNRRKLLYGILGLVVTACRRSSPEKTMESDTSEPPNCAPQDLMISLDEYPELREIDGSVQISFPDQWVHLVVVKQAEESWIAVWKICTHGNCNVEWIPYSEAFQCPCHDSWFAPDGQVLQGPATVDLTSYSVCRIGENLYLTKVQ